PSDGTSSPSARRGSRRRHPVEEAEDRLDPAVGAQDRDVQPHDRGSAARRPELPAEPTLPMVAVDRAGEAEREVGEAPLGGGEGGVDVRVAVGEGERVDVAPILGPEGADRGPAGGWVGLVPSVDVTGCERFEVGHGNSSRVSGGEREWLPDRFWGPVGRKSIT